MIKTTKQSLTARTLLLTGAVLMAGQAAAVGKNDENNPGANHRQAGNQQHEQMREEAELRRQQADQMREQGEEAAARGQRDMEQRREHAEDEMESRREQGEARMERHRDDMERAANGQSGRPANAGSSDVNPGERGSEQGQESKQEHSKAWWNFWD
ncbi:hypothetical protein [Marinobacter zhejiangensis]|uniref:Uncharacterized protein n=1 Tax=Marinobacter zhejiangensis TaxID=488535 RepID=A0A1I4TH50_9GAMM|nr:hypothetical protein [Marinobacter zhejiangensis]SFM75985.1 hypothetical protein SAMN04487963_3624 [Marinobacter zhejiangensis]